MRINHRRRDTWTPILNRIKSRIASWSKSQISFGGRVILINVILSAIPLYFPSFYKAPLSAIQSIHVV
ncbi:hypothetical protein Lal_00044771 [Lupinus albus]|nr:hypothetical protein Lal_00044771 [Lupinus albus]